MSWGQLKSQITVILITITLGDTGKTGEWYCDVPGIRFLVQSRFRTCLGPGTKFRWKYKPAGWYVRLSGLRVCDEVSDGPRLVTWPWHWPLMGHKWSCDFYSGLWWAKVIMWPGYWPLICCLGWWWQHRMPQHHLVSGLGAMQHWSTSGVNIKHIEASPFRRFPTAKQTQGYIDKSWFWQVQMLSNFSVQSDLVRHDMRHLITLIFFFQLIRLFRNIETWFL